jgi:hypothetical protein
MVHILAKLVLLMATFFFGYLWWQLGKRAIFLKRILRSQPGLDTFISKEKLVNSHSRIEPYVPKNSIGYFINIDLVLKADHSSQRVPKVISSICLLLILGVSLHLGYAYLAINLGLLCALGFWPIEASAGGNALDQVLTLAVILYRWHEENPGECDKFVAEARSLQKLYGAVRKAT